MFDLDDLLQPKLKTKLVKGKWCSIGFAPSVGNGERLNIGVLFKPNRGKAQAKLITNTAGFRSLYGSTGVENFSFLIAVTAEHIQRTGSLTEISPHISFGPLRPIQGQSVEEILDSLYQTIVTLRLLEEQESTTSKTINTAKLRQSVFRELRREFTNQADRFLHEQPVIINYENRAHLLDLPVWQAEDLVSGRLFGSIVSAHYADEVYRQHDLDRAFRNLDTAKRFISTTGCGSLFILRPSSNDNSFPLREIDNDIDAVAWPLTRSGIHVEVEDNTAAIQKRVANFICNQ
jgi:hypothetical protein